MDALSAWEAVRTLNPDFDKMKQKKIWIFKKILLFCYKNWVGVKNRCITNYNRAN